MPVEYMEWCVTCREHLMCVSRYSVRGLKSYPPRISVCLCSSSLQVLTPLIKTCSTQYQIQIGLIVTYKHFLDQHIKYWKPLISYFCLIEEYTFPPLPVQMVLCPPRCAHTHFKHHSEM